mmetsp:Transcript_96999/g.230764  ORF Transcript_96999/g.230764 Transcript_96999/m.230764 type:complete len:262 (-) Transcript_96999:2500-3285(-)
MHGVAPGLLAVHKVAHTVAHTQSYSKELRCMRRIASHESLAEEGRHLAALRKGGGFGSCFPLEDRQPGEEVYKAGNREVEQFHVRTLQRCPQGALQHALCRVTVPFQRRQGENRRQRSAESQAFCWPQLGLLEALQRLQQLLRLRHGSAMAEGRAESGGQVRQQPCRDLHAAQPHGPHRGAGRMHRQRVKPRLCLRSLCQALGGVGDGQGLSSCHGRKQHIGDILSGTSGCHKICRCALYFRHCLIAGVLAAQDAPCFCKP